VWGCNKRAMARCNSCHKWLCENHIALEFHKPCKGTQHSSSFDFCKKTV
jgi:hypothetical protein